MPRSHPIARLRPILAAALLLFVLTAGTAWAAGAGTVVGLAGDCSVESGGNRTELKLGASVAVGDTVDVPANGKLRLRMADGSIVAVAPGTRLTITVYTVADNGKREEARLSLTQGLMRAIVTPTEPIAKFEVETAVSSAGARSTDWFVEAAPGNDRIAVLSGSVTVIGSAKGGSVIVPEHRETTVKDGEDPTPPRPLTQAAINALLARTEFPQPRRATKTRQPSGEPSGAPSEYTGAPPPMQPPPMQPPGGYYPPPPPPPQYYQPYPVAPAPVAPFPIFRSPRGGGYQPGGGGGYQPPSRGYEPPGR